MGDWVVLTSQTEEISLDCFEMCNVLHRCGDQCRSVLAWGVAARGGGDALGREPEFGAKHE